MASSITDPANNHIAIRVPKSEEEEAEAVNPEAREAQVDAPPNIHQSLCFPMQSSQQAETCESFSWRLLSLSCLVFAMPFPKPWLLCIGNRKSLMKYRRPRLSQWLFPGKVPRDINFAAGLSVSKPNSIISKEEDVSILKSLMFPGFNALPEFLSTLMQKKIKPATGQKTYLKTA